ncbi:MAG: shikimate dehydrogenase, partial [Lachnospiraceae bacterium]|nr:shikimate dehydrogenase [Lachnospiraceae bacterium]
MNVILVGFMGTGKTSVARALHELTGWPWLDLDDEITRRAGKTIPAIFEDEGESGFRDRETQVL